MDGWKCVHEAIRYYFPNVYCNYFTVLTFGIPMHTDQEFISSPTLSTQSGNRSLADLAPEQIKSVVDEYLDLNEADTEQRKEHYQRYVTHFFNLVTDFYEYGWGSSFHFAPRRRGESFKASIRRHQTFLSDQLSLKPGMQILDVGCGVGGPMASLAQYSGSNFVGLNNNPYQIERAKVNTRDVRSLCRFINGDFMQIPVCDDYFDGAFAIDSMPHAPNKTEAYQETFRVLRPGACFAGYEWCLTDEFDPQNTEHLRIKKGIEIGNGLPDTVHTSEVCSALCMAGFELLDTRDLAFESDPQTPWYRALEGRDLSLSSIQRVPVGRALTHLVLRIGERFKFFPEGATMVSAFLRSTADALIDGGKTGTFTPIYFFLAQKPR